MEHQRLAARKTSLSIPTAIVDWLKAEYVIGDERTIAKEHIYSDYEKYCRGTLNIKPKDPNTFGKIVARVFPHVFTRRLGPISHQVTHYSGIARKDSLENEGTEKSQTRRTRRRSPVDRLATAKKSPQKNNKKPKKEVPDTPPTPAPASPRDSAVPVDSVKCEACAILLTAPSSSSSLSLPPHTCNMPLPPSPHYQHMKPQPPRIQEQSQPPQHPSSFYLLRQPRELENPRFYPDEPKKEAPRSVAALDTQVLCGRKRKQEHGYVASLSDEPSLLNPPPSYFHPIQAQHLHSASSLSSSASVLSSPSTSPYSSPSVSPVPPYTLSSQSGSFSIPTEAPFFANSNYYLYTTGYITHPAGSSSSATLIKPHSKIGDGWQRKNSDNIMMAECVEVAPQKRRKTDNPISSYYYAEESVAPTPFTNYVRKEVNQSFVNNFEDSVSRYMIKEEQEEEEVEEKVVDIMKSGPSHEETSDTDVWGYFVPSEMQKQRMIPYV